MIYAALIITVFWSLFGDLVHDKYAFEVFFILNQAVQLFVSIELFRRIRYRMSAKKMATFVLVGINAWVVANFFVILLFEDERPVEVVVNLLFCLSFLVYCVLSYMSCWRNLRLTRTRANENGSYIVFKKPSNKIGLLGAFFSPPFGHRYLVIGNMCYWFSDGVLVERHYVPDKGHLYLPIHDLDVEMVRRNLVGSRFSLFNNCLTAFNERALRKFYAK